MKKMERMLAIILELQSREWTRAEDLAAHFEVSQRTIYRDVQALSEAAVPIISVTGQGYSLMAGYFLPPLNFNSDEALMLILGSDFMAKNFDAQYRQAAETASHKIEAAMPTRLKNEVAYLRQNISFHTPPTQTPAQNDLEPLKQLRRAIIGRRQVKLSYSKRFGTDESHTAEQTTRTIDPYSLARLSIDWYLLAYCHLRQEFRVFRLARIDQLTILPTSFNRSPAFQPDWINPSNSQNIIVKAIFKPEIIRWVKETHTYYPIDTQETEAGLLVTLFVRDEREILQWFLGWGNNVRVLEPETLCQRLIDEAQNIIDLYNPT